MIQFIGGFLCGLVFLFLRAFKSGLFVLFLFFQGELIPASYVAEVLIVLVVPYFVFESLVACNAVCGPDLFRLFSFRRGFNLFILLLRLVAFSRRFCSVV